ncbi:MAG: ROK family transcriptional regulator [Clostridiaceae bacterium]|nr:ROK family transcriptional regulator [Clostridiaceae bacterium]
MNRAATNKEVRINNQKNIVNTLFRYGPMTKQELSVRLNLSLPTISVIYKDLAAKGLVAHGEKLESTGGRRPSPIMLVFDARLSIGVGISTNHVRLVLVNLGPTILNAQKHTLTYSGTVEYWQKVKQLIHNFIEENKVDQSILLGVGFSVQAPIKSGAAVLPSSRPVDMTGFEPEILNQVFEGPVAIYNNAKMACLAQVWGAGEEDDMVYLMLSGGVGGAIITDHRLLRGESKNAEFGHMIVRENGRPCSCGQRGCLGAYCSTRALQERAGVTIEDFFKELEAGNPSFHSIWDEYLDVLALAVRNLYMIFDTDIIIGGEMSEHVAAYLDQLRQRVARLNPFGSQSGFVRIGSFGEYDSAFGAALLHNDRFLS